MDAINERADQFICLPSPQQQAIIAEEIEERRSFPHCVGFLDGSLIPIPKPKVWLCMLEKRWRLNQNILKKILTHVLQGLRNRLHHAQEPARDEFPIFGGFQICHSWCSFRYGKHFFLIHVVFFLFLFHWKLLRITGYPGSAHDFRMLSESSLFRKFHHGVFPKVGATTLKFFGHFLYSSLF